MRGSNGNWWLFFFLSEIGMKEDLQNLHLQYPGMKFIFSGITQRRRWKARRFLFFFHFALQTTNRLSHYAHCNCKGSFYFFTQAFGLDWTVLHKCFKLYMLSYIFILWFVMSTISTVINNVALVIQVPLFIMQNSLVTVKFAFTLTHSSDLCVEFTLDCKRWTTLFNSSL